MKKEHTEYKHTCTVHNTDKSKDVTADVLDFYPEKHLIVSIEKSAKVTLKYNHFHGIYVGSSAGLEFTSNGPERYDYKA